jgi:quaternary ammonium compound-resistance protein SugE
MIAHTPNAAHDRSDSRSTKVGPWLALLIASLFEVGYALSVNGSEGFTNLIWSIVAIAFFLLTLLFLSIALKKIDVSIGYAVWAGLGAVGAALLGPVFFDEVMTPTKGFWLAVIIAGVVWLKLADRTTTSRSAGSPDASSSVRIRGAER